LSAKNLKTRLKKTLKDLNSRLTTLDFGPPVTHVYNPLLYAAKPAEIYLERYLCGPPGRTLLLGMNPGPWGMAQTGVPFGEIESVRDWLGIEAKVEQPKESHPKRPILGFECQRSEVSGRRLWGLFQEKFPDPADFAKQFVVFNYCPLIFLEDSGRNRTPDKLPKAERDPLFDSCDDCLASLLDTLQIKRAFGVGKFAEKRLKAAAGSCSGLTSIASVLHPSPASPAANRGWAEQAAPVLGL
jgi:single-strand selective monofunctional uracil DNA glycosylase